MLKTQNIRIRQRPLGPNNTPGALGVPKVEEAGRGFLGPSYSETAPLGHVTCKPEASSSQVLQLWGAHPMLTSTWKRILAPSQARCPPFPPTPTHSVHLHTNTSEGESLTETWGCQQGLCIACHSATGLPPWAPGPPGPPGQIFTGASSSPFSSQASPCYIIYSLPRFSPHDLHTPFLCIMLSHSLSWKFHPVRNWDSWRCTLLAS